MTAATSPFQRYDEPKPDFSGHWQAVIFTPDLASHQGFVVGVVAHSQGKVASFRLLQDFQKLECVYGDGLAANVGYLFDRARNALGSALRSPSAVPNLNSISPHFTLTPPLFISGATAESAANEIYLQVVALEPKEKSKKKLEFTPRDTQTVRASVHDMLRQHLALDYERWIKPIGLNVRHDGRDVDLSVDVFTGDKGICASITSGWYTARATMELHALRALRDLHAAREHFDARLTGLILVRPVSGLPEATLLDIDNFVGDFEARAQEGGVRFSAPGSDEEAAKAVLELLDS